jgi:hypothetical protein
MCFKVATQLRPAQIDSCAWPRGSWRHCFNVAVACLLASSFLGHAEPLRIIVAGDGRADYPDPNDPKQLPSPRSEDKNGFNKIINSEIRDAVRNEKAEILVWTGDIVNVNYSAGPEFDDKTRFFRNGLSAWRKLMQPLYQNRVKVLPTRGNHEVFWYDEQHRELKIPDATKIWTTTFSGRYALPVREPSGLSFYYVRDSVLMIGLDQYEHGEEHSVNQAWLDKVLRKNRKPFIFAYGHEPAFPNGGMNGPEDSLAHNLEERDRMWRSLSDAGAQVYFCAHDHFYDHMIASAENGAYKMHQVTAGTAGAPFFGHQDTKNGSEGTSYYPPAPGWNLKPVRHFDFIYGYVLITINGNRATIAFKGRTLDGKYTTKDSFGYSAGSTTN